MLDVTYEIAGSEQESFYISHVNVKMRTALLCVYCETEKLTECINKKKKVLINDAIVQHEDGSMTA